MTLIPMRFALHQFWRSDGPVGCALRKQRMHKRKRFDFVPRDYLPWMAEFSAI